MDRGFVGFWCGANPANPPPSQKPTQAVGRRGHRQLPHTMYCVNIQFHVATFCRLELHLCFKVDKPVEANNG